MLAFKKILSYWNTAQERSKLQMDVTQFRCEEDTNSMQLLDENGRMIAEFGPGRQYDNWMLTVEYGRRRY
jgi:hypothetical protein